LRLHPLRTSSKLLTVLLKAVAGRRPVFVFLEAFRFAQPPTGELRWREPQAVKNWEGCVMAIAFNRARPTTSASALHQLCQPDQGVKVRPLNATLCLCITMCLTAMAQERGWRGVVPLHSTKADVERLLASLTRCSARTRRSIARQVRQ